MAQQQVYRLIHFAIASEQAIALRIVAKGRFEAGPSRTQAQQLVPQADLCISQSGDRIAAEVDETTWAPHLAIEGDPLEGHVTENRESVTQAVFGIKRGRIVGERWNLHAIAVDFVKVITTRHTVGELEKGRTLGLRPGGQGLAGP